MSTRERVSQKSRTAHIAFKITAIYLLISFCWIILSDWVLAVIEATPYNLSLHQTYKGLAFVTATAGVLFALVQRSIAAHQRVEAERRASDEMIRLLVENVQDYAIFMLDPQGRVVTWNAGAERITGYRAEEIIGEHFSRFATSEDREASGPGRRLETAQKNGRLRDEGWRVRKDGSRFWAEVVLTSLRSESGELRGFSQVTRDITLQKKAAEALRESETRLRAILETASDAIITTDDQGIVRSFNRAAEQMFGYSADEVIGHNVNILIPEPYRSEHDRSLAECKDTGGGNFRGFRRELAGKHKLGHVFAIELSVSKVDLPDAPMFTAVIRDITERKALEEQLRHSQKMEAVGKLAGGVAHDFNNLLTAMMGYSELLLSRIADRPDALEYAEEIRTLALRAGDLTHQLLAFGRRQVLKPQVTNLNEIVMGLEKMLRRLIGEDVELVLRGEPELGAVRADRGQIEQVIVNLVINGRDAMPRGGTLTLEVANVELDEQYPYPHLPPAPGPYVMLAVSDTGVGMDATTKSRIFEPFFTTKELGKGTGLGLSTVYGIVAQSGGTIVVYSEPGKGSSFKIYLPQVPDKPEPISPKPAETQEVRGSETILLVEDEEAVRGLVRKILEEHSYTVLEAADPEQALQASDAFDGTIHLLLSDMVMPKKDGRELARQLRGRRPEIKVIFMSGYAHAGAPSEGPAILEAPVISKPFSAKDLLRTVRETFG